MARIYVACLASYNAGSLFGEWIDIDGLDKDDILEAITNMLGRSSQLIAEDWAIHDYEDFGEFKVNEHHDLEELAIMADLLDKHGDAISAYYNETNTPLDSLEENFEDACYGEYSSFRKFAEEHFDEINEIPKHLINYIDYSKVESDYGYDFNYINLDNGNVLVYRNV